MKLAPKIVIFASMLAASTLQAKWGRIPVMQQKPVNVAAQGAHSTVSIDSASGVGQVDNLINGADVTAPASFTAGKSFFIVNFGKPVMISNSSMSNDGVEGKVALSASADKNGWAILEEKVFSAADREINFKFAGIQAKFLKYEFILSKGGNMRALTVYGNQTDYGYALKQDPNGEKGKPMNFAGGLGGARLIYAAPKPVNGIDSAANFNKFEFPESDEQYRTLIYDMGQVRVMNEFSSVHSESPVRFEVFTFEKLPEKEDWRGRLAFDPSDFNLSKPVVAYEDKVGTGNIRVKPSKPVKTRYLALRWEPDFNPPAFIIASTAIVGNVSQVQGQQSFSAVVNGETVTVTVDPGPAVGAGTTEAQATVTVTTPSGASVTYSGAGVTGVNVTATGIQIVTGSTPSAISNVAPAIATISVGTGGTLSAAPTPAGVLLGVPPATATGGATVSSVPPAGSSTSVDAATAQVIAEALGTTVDAVTAAVTSIVETVSAPGGQSTNVQTLEAVASTAIESTAGTAPTNSVGSTGAATGAVSASATTGESLALPSNPTANLTPGAPINGGGTVISVTSP